MASISQIHEGLTILLKYVEKADDPNSFDAQHDIIYAGPDRPGLLKEDEDRLLELGWHIDAESDSWARFT